LGFVANLPEASRKTAIAAVCEGAVREGREVTSYDDALTFQVRERKG
jgi:hypothetical protein